MEITAIALEDFMFFNVDDDVEVAGGTAFAAGVALSLDTEAGTGIDAGGDADSNAGSFFPASLTPASTARAVNDLA